MLLRGASDVSLHTRFLSFFRYIIWLWVLWFMISDDITNIRVGAAFGSLRTDNDLSDVTLACEDGQQIEAHKVILSVSSPIIWLWVLCFMIPDDITNIRVGAGEVHGTLVGREAKQDTFSHFAPTPRQQLRSWAIQIGAGMIHCARKGWDDAKQDILSHFAPTPW